MQMPKNLLELLTMEVEFPNFHLLSGAEPYIIRVQEKPKEEKVIVKPKNESEQTTVKKPIIPQMVVEKIKKAKKPAEISTTKEEDKALPLIPFREKAIDINSLITKNFSLNSSVLSVDEDLVNILKLLETKGPVEASIYLAQLTKKDQEELLKEVKKEREAIITDIQNKLKQISEIQKKELDKFREEMTNYINSLNSIFQNLMAKEPKLDPDEKTTWARNLAMGLMAISSFFHPSHSMYFLAAIPKVVEYWKNEDLENFKMAMERFKAAAEIANMRIQHLSNVLGHTLTLLQKTTEVETFPLLQELDLLKRRLDGIVKNEAELYKEGRRAIREAQKQIIKSYEEERKAKREEEKMKLEREKFEFDKLIESLRLKLRAAGKKASETDLKDIMKAQKEGEKYAESLIKDLEKQMGIYPKETLGAHLAEVLVSSFNQVLSKNPEAGSAFVRGVLNKLMLHRDNEYVDQILREINKYPGFKGYIPEPPPAFLEKKKRKWWPF